MQYPYPFIIEVNSLEEIQITIFGIWNIWTMVIQSYS